MSLIHRDVTGIYNGVSQQAPPLRLPNQVSDQVNFLSSITSGIEKRPGTKHVANLPGSRITANAFSYVFRDSEGVDYLVFITGNRTHLNYIIEIYRLDGTRCTLAEINNVGYLYADVPRKAFRACAVADYVIIANREITCDHSRTYAPTQEPYALLWVKRGVVSTTYSVGGISFTTADSTTATDVSTHTIAEELTTRLNTAGVYVAEQVNAGGVVRITGSRELIDNLTASDSYGNSALVLVKGKATKIEDLPPYANDGDVVEIVKDESGMLAGYYMKYSKADNLWVETVAPEAIIGLSAATLPHVLVRTAPNTFRFDNAKLDGEMRTPLWEERKAGDDISAPLPSFIGHTVRDVFYHKNRLGFLSGQNVVFSKPNDYFNFFPDTVSTTLDTDPIDRAMGFNEPVVLEWAVPFKEDLLLFTKNRQFLMSSGLESFTAEKAMIDPVTNYPCSVEARPENLGSSLLFPADDGAYSLVREYFVQGETLQNDAADITAHCPRYIPSGAIRMAHLMNSGTLLIQCEGEPRKLWVYRYYWSGSEKPQSAWSVFEFPFDILTMNVVDELVYLTVRQRGVVRLSTLDLSTEPRWCMDGQFICEDKTYDPKTDTTTLVYPYASDVEMAVVHVATDGSVRRGITVKSAGPKQLTVSGDLTQGEAYVGQPFRSVCTLSEFFVSPDGKAGTLQGRLQLRSLTLSYAATGNFRLEISYHGRPTLTHNCTRAVVGDSLFATDGLRSERRRFMVQGDSRNLSVSIINSDVLPSTFDSFSFEGTYHVRTQRTP